MYTAQSPARTTQTQWPHQFADSLAAGADGGAADSRPTGSRPTDSKATNGKTAGAAQIAVPSGRSFVALLQAFRATGGTVPANVVARLLEDHKSTATASLERLVVTGRVFGFEWRGSLWIPMFQFSATDLSVHASAERVRAALPAEWSGWAVAAWFAAPQAQLQGRCPSDMLHAGAALVQDAAHAARRGASVAQPRVWRAQPSPAHA